MLFPLARAAEETGRRERPPGCRAADHGPLDRAARPSVHHRPPLGTSSVVRFPGSAVSDRSSAAWVQRVQRCHADADVSRSAAATRHAIVTEDVPGRTASPVPCVVMFSPCDSGTGEAAERGEFCKGMLTGPDWAARWTEPRSTGAAADGGGD